MSDCHRLWIQALIGCVVVTIGAAACDAQSSPTGPTVAVQFSLAGRVSSESAGLPASRVEIVSGTNAGTSTTTDTEGRYSFAGLLAGEFVVRASADGYQPQTAGVTLDSNKTRDFTLPRQQEPRGSLAGTVSDASATGSGASALESAQVAVTSGVNAGRSTVTDGQGRYVLADLALTAEEMTVEASAPGYVTELKRLRLSEQPTADFALRRNTDPPPNAVSLAGVITESSAPFAPVASARVGVTAGPQAGRSITTDAQGRYQIDGLSPEPLMLEVSALGYVTETRSVTPQTGQPVDFRLQLTDSAARTSGRIVDILSRAGLEGIAISGDGVAPASSGSDGLFRVTGATGSAVSRLFEFTGAGVVTRRTWLRVPEEADVEISLIPNGFDQRAFDEMLRAPMLRRWTAAPPIVIERRALEFTHVDMTEAVAATESMSEGEAQSLLADLTWALPQLTGGRFNDFDLVAWQTAQPGATVRLLNTGVITVVRVKGLADSKGAWGWSRWLYGGTGIVVGGLVMLDDAFERSASPYLRSLRAHELGHALGYTHVSATLSVMNADGRVEPTPFDHDATRIAFDRPPGNRAPDTDPEPAQLPQRTSAPRWSDPVR